MSSSEEDKAGMQSFFDSKLSSDMRFFSKAGYTAATPAKKINRAWKCKACGYLMPIVKAGKSIAPPSCENCKAATFTLLTD